MKNLLVIANLHHASPRIPGLLNPLFEDGWKATILTAPLGNSPDKLLGFPEGFSKSANIIEVNYRGDIFWRWRKIFKFFGFNTKESLTEQLKERKIFKKRTYAVDLSMKIYQTLFAFPDTEKTWRKPVLKYINSMDFSKYDAIISSSPFATSHLLALEVVKKTKLPWLVDYRDPWSQNPIYYFPYIRKLVEIQIEKNYLDYSSAVTTVSHDYAKAINNIYSGVVNVIPNGFTFNRNKKEKVSLTKKFSITYTGVIYDNKQDPDKILEALEILLKKKIIKSNDLEVRFYGKINNYLSDQIVKRNLSKYVFQFGTIERVEAVKKQRESQLLLFFGWEDRLKKGASHLKLYEYFSSERPIIATGGSLNSSSSEIILHTKSGYVCPSVNDIKKKLTELYFEYLDNKKVIYHGNSKIIDSYSYVNRSKELKKILEEII